MSHRRVKLGVSGAVVALVILLSASVAGAQGSVTPSYGDGTLTLDGEGYRAGEMVEITVRVAGSTQTFSARADARGRFQLATGLQIAPMSRVEIEARDEAGMTQVTTTSGPGAVPGPGGGMPVTAPGGGMPLPPPGGGTPLPASEGGAQPPSSGGGVQTPGPRGGMPLPTQLPRTGNASGLPLGLVSLAAIAVVGGLALWGRRRSRRA